MDDGLINGTTYYYRLKARDDAGNESAYSEEVSATPSDSPPATGAIEVLTPNGRESWPRSSPQEITWTSQDVTGRVRIDIMRGSKAINLAKRTANDGHHGWTVVPKAPIRDDFKICVSSVADPSVRDCSDGFFSIVEAGPPSITVLTPNGGESWPRSSPQEITWTSENVQGQVKVTIMKGAKSFNIAKRTPNDGLHPWTVVPKAPLRDNYKVCVTSLADASVNDCSDQNFSIVAAKGQVASVRDAASEVLGKAMALDADDPLPTDYSLLPNYPNPFNPVTVIAYELPKSSQVRLTVYDVLGREVEQLVSAQQGAGRYVARFDASALGAGTYIYVLEAGAFREVRLLTLLK